MNLCNLRQKVSVAIFILEKLHVYLKDVHHRKIHFEQLTNSFIFKRLQHYHFCYLIKLQWKSVFMIFSLSFYPTLKQFNSIKSIKRSNDNTFQINKITETVPSLSKVPSTSLNFADTFPLSSTNNNLFQPKSNLNSFAKPTQTLYQPHTTSNLRTTTFIDKFYHLESSCKSASINKPPCCKERKYNKVFIEMNTTVNYFVGLGLDHQHTSDEF